MDKFIVFFKADDGVTAIEYALIASLIFLMIIGAVASLGTTLENNFYNEIANAFS